MNSRGKYKTKHYDELLTYLQNIKGEHFTVEDIHNHFCGCNCNMGTTTIYRNLERMIDEGVVNKYNIESGSPACFEYVDPNDHKDSEVCYHLKCEKCGTLIHVHCEEIEEFNHHIFAEHRFKINPMRTGFYGICENCAEQDI